MSGCRNSAEQERYSNSCFALFHIWCVFSLYSFSLYAFSPDFFKNIKYGRDSICLAAFFHCIDISLAAAVELVYFFCKKVGRKIIFIDNDGEALRLERAGVYNLVSAACTGRKRNEQIGFF